MKNLDLKAVLTIAAIAALTVRAFNEFGQGDLLTGDSGWFG